MATKLSGPNMYLPLRCGFALHPIKDRMDFSPLLESDLVFVLALINNVTETTLCHLLVILSL